jgi:hypothetical protein
MSRPRADTSRAARPAGRLTASALLLAFVLTPAVAQAQSPKLAAAYVVLGPQGPVARALLADATVCPAVTIDGAQQPMNVRAMPDAAFPVLVRELPIPSGATSASIESSPLPLPKTTLKSIAVFGDTGCRLKAKKTSSKVQAPEDDDDSGKFQDCNNPSLWPFAQLAASVAAAKPDLVIHVGDYLYRESACPPRDQGCKDSPHRDDWPTWQADFFAPAAPALRAAPWIVVRGNHEICKRAGAGYFRLLDPAPAQTPPPCVDLIGQFTVTVADQSFIVMDTSNAADACPCDTAPYAAQFAAMRPAPRNLARHASAGVGLPVTPPDRQCHLATSPGGLERQATGRHRARLGRPNPCRGGVELCRQARPAIRARHRRHAARRQDQERPRG